MKTITGSPRFTFVPPPRLVFGGALAQTLPEEITAFPGPDLLLTGGSSFRRTPDYDQLLATLRRKGRTVVTASVRGEPSPEVVDTLAAAARTDGCRTVIGIGGGAVLDAAKAVAVTALGGHGVQRYLEGVGDLTPPDRRLRLLAVPTTAGTGSEATMNAVIRRVGDDGFKKSLRHPAYVPDTAVIDPSLVRRCPPALTAACGMDALSQLLEGYLSTNASPLTDTLAERGLTAVLSTLPAAATGEAEAASAMSYGAFLSGTVLANAGLGAVHGLAGPLGGWVDLPHGVACGRLLPGFIDLAVKRMTPNRPLTRKLAFAGRCLRPDLTDDRAAARALRDTLGSWPDRFQLPALSSFGVTASHLRRAAALQPRKYTPFDMAEDDFLELAFTG